MTASVRDSGCEDLEANQTDGRRLTPEGTRTRVATRTSSVSVRAKGCESRRAEHEYRRTLRAGHGPQRPDCLAGHVRFELRNVVANYAFEKSRGFAGNQPNSGHGDHSRLSCGVTETTNGCGLPPSAPSYQIDRLFIWTAKPIEPRAGAIVWDLVRPAAQAQ
jgi:hypothetical protein